MTAGLGSWAWGALRDGNVTALRERMLVTGVGEGGVYVGGGGFDELRNGSLLKGCGN